MKNAPFSSAASLQCLNNIDLAGFRIALIVPPLNRGVLYGEWNLSGVDSISPPIGLLSIAAMTRNFGGTPGIHDAYARGLTLVEVIKEALASNPDAIGITCMTPSFPQVKLLVSLLKQAAPSIPIILGGAHISALPESVMRELPELDVGVLKEGEITVVELLHAIKHKKKLETVKGIIFRTAGQIVETEPRGFIENLDVLPFPAWDLLPSLGGEYQMSIVGTKGDHATSLLTTRGCPGKCTFCDVGAVGGKVRGFSAGYVIRMMEHLINCHGITDFLIYDDNFVALGKRLKEICEEIIGRNWNIHWSCSARVDMVRPELLTLMKKAGCWQIEYGIESGSQKILDVMQKHITLKQIEQALKWTKEAGIETRGNFIFGFPGETRKSLRETIRFSLNIDLDYFQQTFFTPFPGSPIHEQIEKYGAFDRDLRKMNNFSINFVPHGLSEKILNRYSSRAFMKFYLRRKIILFHLMKIVSISGFRRLFISFFVFLRTIWKK